MWPVLKHLGKILREYLGPDTKPLTCPMCGKPESLAVTSALMRNRPTAWRCESCGFVVGKAPVEGAASFDKAAEHRRH